TDPREFHLRDEGAPIRQHSNRGRALHRRRSNLPARGGETSKSEPSRRVPTRRSALATFASRGGGCGRQQPDRPLVSARSARKSISDCLLANETSDLGNDLTS